MMKIQIVKMDHLEAGRGEAIELEGEGEIISFNLDISVNLNR